MSDGANTVDLVKLRRFALILGLILFTYTVAGINAEEGTIILDAMIWPGNSGGPVLQVDRGNDGSVYYRVVGVVTQFVPFLEHRALDNSGYAVAVPMDDVLELLESNGVKVREDPPKEEPSP